VGDTVPGPVNPCDILGYNIYRREYTVFPAGPNGTGAGSYNWIGSVPFGTNEFVDRDLNNLLNNCYEYKVTELYVEGEGIGSTAWDCIYVSTKEPEKSSVEIYPNPANDFLTIEMKSPVESITIYNLTGSKVAELKTDNKQDARLDVSGFSPGIYNLRFNTAKGESFSRKFVKL
jgi:hypothetical protein